MSRFSVILLLIAVLTACGSNPATPVRPPATGTAPTPTALPFSWDTKPGSILFRIDRQIVGETPVEAMNRLPLCTVYGDGYMTWITGEQVLEARVNGEIIRSFLDFIIRDQHFYSVQDYAAKQLPPPGKHVIEMITLRISNETRTVRSYSNWSGGEFTAILERCTRISPEPVIYQPTGAWLSVQPIAGSQMPRMAWSKSNPLHIGEIATSGKPMWISGNVLGFFWSTLRGARNGVQFVEDGKTYLIGLQVPGVSRESPPMPEVTPTMPVVIPTATRTPGPTSTPSLPRDAAVSATPVPTKK